MAVDKKPVAQKRAATAKAPTTKKPAAKKAILKSLPIIDEAEATSQSFRDQANSFKDKASDKAREYANSGKEKTTDMLDNVSKTVDDLARTVDERLGSTYGDYARKAANAVSGVADTLKGKDVDDIVADTRNFVRKQPAVAIGAAVAVGFLLTRLMRSGSNERDDA